MSSLGARSRFRRTRAATLAFALMFALLVQFAGPLSAWANPAAQGATTVTDVVGRTVTVKTPVERVILSEGRQVYVTATLDKDDPFKRVVGWGDDLRTADYDSYVQYLEKFPHLQQIPVMGSPQSGSFSVEKAVELQPDVVIFGLDSYPAARDAGLVDVLAGAGIPSVVIDFRQQPLETTVPSILLLGRVYGKQAEAQELVDYYTQQISIIFARVEKIKTPPPTFFILRAAGLLDCCGTFGRANLGILGERAGGANIAAGLFPGWSGTVNPEKVLSSDPDIIIATGSNWTYQPNAKQYIPFGYHTTPEQARTALRQLTDQPGWAGLKAVQSGRFYAVWHQFYISPFHFAVLQQFAKWMYPTEFADIDPEANLRTYHEKFLPINYGGTFWVGLND